MADRPTPAYSCKKLADGGRKCDRWCGDCIASPALVSARAMIEARYTGQGAAAPKGAPNPYREGSAAATWWQRGNDGVRASDEISRDVQCSLCKAITHEGNGCSADGCPVGVAPSEGMSNAE